MRWLSALAFLAFSTSVHAAEDWLQPTGAGEYTWGTDMQPFDAVPRPRDFFLPDSGYLGRSPADKPDDVEISGPHPGGERRFLRYVHGQLVDAWLVREGPIDTSAFEQRGTLEWKGVTLGPAPDGYRAYGDAVSWAVGDRTVLHWKDRSSKLEILANRAQPSGQYGVERAGPLEPGRDGNHKAKITGDLREYVKDWAGPIAGCLDLSPMPVEGEITIVYDGRGRPGRIKAQTDQPAMEVLECWAAAVVQSSAPVGTTHTARIFRFR